MPLSAPSRHTCPMALDLPAIVTAFWRHYELSEGDRAQRLAADTERWAWEVVHEAVHEPSEDVLAVLDALLAAPNADPCYIGAGPIEDLLSADGRAWQEAVARRCRTSRQWREALACVVLSDRDEQNVPMLSEYLPRPEPTPSEQPLRKVRRKTSRDLGAGHRRG